jgi:MFS family permease
MRALGDIRGRAIWVVIGCLLCQMGLGLGYVPAQLAEGMLAELGWSRAEWAAAYAPQLVTQALASPLVGLLVVARGIRSVLTVSVLLLIAVFAAFGAVSEPWHVWALAALMGVGLAGVGDVTVGAAVARWVSKSRGLALGLVYGGANLGGGMLGMIAAWLMLQSDWRIATFAVAGIAGALMLPAAIFAVREPREGELVAVDETEIEEGPSLTLREALRTRTFWLLFFALFAVFFSFVALTRHMVLLLRDGGLSAEAAAVFFGNAVMIGVVAKVAAGMLADRVPAKRAMLVNHTLFTASFFVLMAIPTAGALPVFFLIYGFSANARDVVYPLLVADSFGSRNLAPIYGVLCLTLLPGGILGPIVAGWAFDTWQSYDVALWIFAGVNALALLALAGVRRETDSRAAR